MKKRVIAVLTAVLMTASLVGCGSGKLSNDYVTVNKYKGLEVTEVAKNEVSDDSVEQEVQFCTLHFYAISKKRRPKEKEKLCQKNRNRKMRISGNSDRLR